MKSREDRARTHDLFGDASADMSEEQDASLVDLETVRTASLAALSVC
jgi:hypothetical protein